jgi:hypothetical protein
MYGSTKRQVLQPAISVVGFPWADSDVCLELLLRI